MRSSGEYEDRQVSWMLVALGGFIAVGSAIAIGAVFGALVRSIALVVLVGVTIAAVWGSRLEVRVTQSDVRVGRAHLDWRHVQRVELLDAAGMQRALSVEGHPSDYRRIRGTTAGLRLWLDDASDPHRAWVVSVRHPDLLRSTLLNLQRLDDPHGA